MGHFAAVVLYSQLGVGRGKLKGLDGMLCIYACSCHLRHPPPSLKGLVRSAATSASCAGRAGSRSFLCCNIGP